MAEKRRLKMICNDFKELKLSALGMGCMRLPQHEDKTIDKEAAAQMVAYAMANGINYYDTAWGYHNGNSELVMGEILEKYDRESFYLATKFPGYSIENMEKVEEIFEKQLSKCRVDYFDFYLFHNVSETNIDGYLDEKYGIYDYLMKQKKNGRIRHLGFSTHGTLETMRRFLDAYGSDMEFCQIQLNWHDWTFQNAKEKVKLISSYGIPVWVMEPVRGGSLAKLEDFYMAKLDALRGGVKPAEWAFRFLQTLPEIKMTLSGMSNMDQLVENIDTYKEAKPLTEKEMQTLFDISAAMTSEKILPCTACRYCTEYCPQKLDIPSIIGHYNEYVYSGDKTAAEALGGISEDKLPSVCIGCGSCEAVCPQNIKISDMMKAFSEKLK